jgi:hypothetical protein
MGQRPNLKDFATLSERAEFIRNFPVGYRKDGRPILLIAGGSGDGEEEDEDDDGTSGASGDKSGSGDTVSRSEFEALQRRMRAADRAKSAAEQRAEELEAAQRSELENAKASVVRLEKENESLKGTVSTLRIDNAFLTASNVKWVDPEAALRLVDMTDVTIGDDGKVEGLEAALQKLAEKKPYLVEKADEKNKNKGRQSGSSEEDSDEDDEDDDTDDDQDDDTSGGDQGSGGAQGGVSGTSTGSGKRRRKQKGPTDEELRARYRIY